MSILKITNLSISFGGIKALRDVELDVEKGELRAIIGPNGAGKTTLFNVISGFYKADSGNIYFEGAEMMGLKAHEVACRGITRTFQKSEIFSKMTVLENVMIGKHATSACGLIRCAMRTGRVRLEEKRIREDCCDILQFLGLEKYKNELASSLPFGSRRLMELGRALATNPKLILLDEPAAGMNVKEIEHLYSVITDIRSKRGITILMVEHNMRLVMEIAERICVLHYGKKLADGTADEIKNHPQVVEAYLGKDV